MEPLQGARVHITGVVQGVGFRPFVYALALRNDLKGWVRNTSAGVDIQVDGTPSRLENFIAQLRLEAPPLARIETLEYEYCSPDGFSTFEIVPSKPVPGEFQPISPDVGICSDCLAEIYDPIRQALSLPIHQLHQLRPPLHHHRRYPLRPSSHHNGELHHVPGLFR